MNTYKAFVSSTYTDLVAHRAHIIRALRDAGIVVDPMEESLSVFRWTGDGYLLVLAAGRDARVRAEPFEAVELPVSTLFGEDEAEDE